MTRSGPTRAAAAAAPAREMSSPVLAALELKSQGRAEDALDVLVRSGTLSVDACNLRGDLEVELGRPEDAARSYTTVLASDAVNAHAQYQLGWCFHALGDWANAADAFRSLLRNATHRDDARLALGGCLLNLARFEEALAVFEQCWSTTSRAQSEFGKGVALQMSRRFDEAERAYSHALILDPQLVEALSNLVAMSLEVFDLQRIQKYSRRLLEMVPDSKIALQGLIMVSLERQELGEAAKAYAQFLQVPAESMPKKSDGPAAAYRLSAEVLNRLKSLLGVRPHSPSSISETSQKGPAGLRSPGWKP